MLHKLYRAGAVLRSIAAVLPEQHEWTVADLVFRFPRIERKQIYNAIGYLARHGLLIRESYGVYTVAKETEHDH